MQFFRHLLSLLGFLQLPNNQRRLVFYSEGKNYWVHLEAIVREMLEQTELPVCYITSGEDDPALTFEHSKFRAFITDEGWVRDWLFQNIDADIMVMTTPDLDQYQLKRSRFPVHYIYVQHSLVSLHMAYRPGAFDHFDTVFCAGPHHVTELRRQEKFYGLEPKQVLEHGYGRLDSIIATATAPENNVSDAAAATKHVLIAPSWGESSVIELVGEEIVDQLLREGFKVTLRPHPQTVRLSRRKVDAIVQKNESHPLFTFENSAASQQSLHLSDIMISDWSGAALEYAFGLAKPVIFIDVPRKVNNADYRDIEIEPFEASIRSEIGDVCAVAELGELSQQIREVLGTPEARLRERMHHIRDTSVFNVGSSHRVAAQYIAALSRARSGAN